MLNWYKRVWVADFEYYSGESGNEKPEPLCMVAIDDHSGTTVRKWLYKSLDKSCPISLDEDSIYVGFYLPAEMTCHAALGWPRPVNCLDLYAELMWITNGLDHPIRAELKRQKIGPKSLLAAMHYFGVGQYALGSAEKKRMQGLATRGGPYTSEETRQMLHYNEDDVVMTRRLLPRMLPYIKHLGQALSRGRFMACMGTVERNGIPVNAELVDRFKSNWTGTVDRLIERDKDRFDVVKHRDVDQHKFAAWLSRNGYSSWPKTECGNLDTSRTTLQNIAKTDLKISELKEFLCAVRGTRLFENLRIGRDGRNRYGCGAFRSKTGRNQPSNTECIFGPGVWVRFMIRAPQGHTLLYCDWSGQEYGMAAFYSGDQKMIHDYVTGDPYLGFAKRINLVAQDATKESHATMRAKLKVAAGLGVLYGAQAETIAQAGNMSVPMAQRLLFQHRITYREFWSWRQSVLDHAAQHLELSTPLGWRLLLGPDSNPNSDSNFPMQAGGADMMRVAVCLAVERGIEVCAPVHDALLVLAPNDAIQDVQDATLECMLEASQIIIENGELKVGVDGPFRYPESFRDARGERMFSTLLGLLEEVEKPTDVGNTLPT